MLTAVRAYRSGAWGRRRQGEDEVVPPGYIHPLSDDDDDGAYERPMSPNGVGLKPASCVMLLG
jgi:hypothetical protein